jgi:hypothetical protein
LGYVAGEGRNDTIAKPLLIELLKKVSDEEVVTLATIVGKHTMKDIVSFMKGRMDPE